MQFIKLISSITHFEILINIKINTKNKINNIMDYIKSVLKYDITCIWSILLRAYVIHI